MYRLTFHTDYKVGDILYGQNSLNFKVININPDNTIDLQFLNPRDYIDIYYRFDSKIWTYYKYKRYDNGQIIPEGSEGYGKYEVAFGEDYDIRENQRDWDNNWKKLSADKIIKGIDPRRSGIAVDFYYNTKQVIERQLNWWGNGYNWGQGPMVVYGDPPYGYYYIPRDITQTVPTKGHTDAEWRPNWGLDASWSVVAGSYKWLQTGNYDDYYGWHRKDNYGPGLNIYQKRISIKFQKGDTGKLQSGMISLSKLKEVNTILDEPNIAPYTEKDLSPIRLFAYDGSFSGKRDYNSVVNNKQLRELKLYPCETVFLDDTTKEHVISLIPVWYDAEKPDAGDNATITNKQYKYSPDGKVWSEWMALPTEISLGDKKLTEYLGYYRIYLKGEYNDSYLTINGVPVADKIVTLTKECYYSIKIQDDNPVLRPVIVEYLDKNDPVYYYDMNRDITDGQRIPSWEAKEGHTYTGYYDYYEYTDEGYNCILKNSQIPLSLARDNEGIVYVRVPFKENGQYYIKVEANYRGLRRITEDAVFLIDTRIPNLPTIITNNNRRYIGPLVETAYDIHLNSVIVDIEYPLFCIPDNFKVEYKRFNFDSWTTISGELGAENRNALLTPREADGSSVSTDNLPDDSIQLSTDNRYNIFNRIGTYRITVRSRKTTLDPAHTSPTYAPYVSGRYAVSNGYSEAIFKVKRKFTYNIIVDTERPTYRVKVAIDFANPVDTNIQSSDKFVTGTMHNIDPSTLSSEEMAALKLKFGDYFQYDTLVKITDPMTGELTETMKTVTETWTGSELVQDYGNVDLYNNKLYRIDGGEWKYYLAPIYIYENCIIECKSVDEDGFESYITKREITNIDKSVPDDPIVNYYIGNSTLAVQMNSSDTPTFNTNIIFNID